MMSRGEPGVCGAGCWFGVYESSIYLARCSSSPCGNSPRASLSSLIWSDGVSSMIVSLHWA